MEALASAGGLLDRVLVLAECESTQTQCRARSQGKAGLLVTTLRQTAGRGRLGRVWHDDRGEGVALTIAVPVQESERMALACAVGVCRAVSGFVEGESVVGRVAIRWPNDVMVDQRKIAGTLVEVADGVAFVGVGVNVHQREWPKELAARAVSLVEAPGGLEERLERIDVVEAVVRELGIALSQPDATLTDAYTKRDVLRGTRQVFRLGGETIEGRVVAVDPLKGLRVATHDGERFLAAPATSLVHGE